MDCRRCEGKCTKAGKQSNGVQIYQCKSCKKYQQASCNVCKAGTDKAIIADVKEGCGIWNTARLMGIAKGTVTSSPDSHRGKSISKTIKPPNIQEKDRSYEVDELYTFTGNKENSLYICYAIERETSSIVDFVVGPRTKKTLIALQRSYFHYSPNEFTLTASTSIQP